MKVFFQTSGGFAGIPSSATLDTDNKDTMSSEEAQQLKELIINSNFFDLQSESAKPKPGSADYIGYSITIDSEGRKHTVKANDITMPSKLYPLVRFLQSKAKINRK